MPGQGVYMDNLSQAIQENRHIMTDTTLYRQYVYDPDQVRREEEEQAALKKKQTPEIIEEQIEETKNTPNPLSTLDSSLLLLLKKFER